eukprot:3480540-Prorocentrum_lima.AAC.1
MRSKSRALAKLHPALMGSEPCLEGGVDAPAPGSVPNMSVGIAGRKCTVVGDGESEIDLTLPFS